MQDSFSFNFILKNKPAPADEFRKIQQPQRSVRIPIPRTSFLKSKTCVFYEEEKKNVRLKKLFFYTFSDINFFFWSHESDRTSKCSVPYLFPDEYCAVLKPNWPRAQGKLMQLVILFVGEFGKTNLSVTVERLVAPWFSTNLNVIADSWYGSPFMINMLSELGLYGIMHISEYVS